MPRPTAPIDVQIADLLHRAGWSVGDFAALGIDGSRVHVVTASGHLGIIRAEAATKPEAWRLALDEVRKLFRIDDPGRPAT